mmetsp:Transcript_169729/g.544712  ORF Transcript_169729/g.544712 Transcript_169729/m.544712 type:complete len:221 (+) Transcript_169729:2064-2726(+)
MATERRTCERHEVASTFWWVPQTVLPGLGTQHDLQHVQCPRRCSDVHRSGIVAVGNRQALDSLWQFQQHLHTPWARACNPSADKLAATTTAELTPRSHVQHVAAMIVLHKWICSVLDENGGYFRQVRPCGLRKCCASMLALCIDIEFGSHPADQPFDDRVLVVRGGPIQGSSFEVVALRKKFRPTFLQYVLQASHIASHCRIEYRRRSIGVDCVQRCPRF